MGGAGTEIGATFVPAVRRTVAAVDIDGEAVLYNEATGSLHALNSPATVVWACCDGAATIAEIASDLAAVFGVDAETMLAHVVDAVRDFARLGLLER